MNETDQLKHNAELGSRKALERMKGLFPRREFRRQWHDLYGYQLLWRAKGSKARWKRL